MAHGNTIRFFFGPHWAHSDAVATRPSFLWCDVYCPEGTGYGQGNRQMYAMLSDGALDYSTALRLDRKADNPFSLAELRLIRDSHKRVELIDLPHDSPLLEPLMAAAEEVRRIGYHDGEFNRALANAEDVIASFVALNRDRERHIVGELARLDDELSAARILVRLGPVHFRAAALAASMGLTVEREFMRVSFGAFGVCYQIANCGRRIPHRALAQYILTSLILRYWHRFAYALDDSEEDRALSRAVRPFGTAEIGELWDRTRADQRAAQEILRRALCLHGVLKSV